MAYLVKGTEYKLKSIPTSKNQCLTYNLFQSASSIYTLTAFSVTVNYQFSGNLYVCFSENNYNFYDKQNSIIGKSGDLGGGRLSSLINNVRGRNFSVQNGNHTSLDLGTYNSPEAQALSYLDTDDGMISNYKTSFKYKKVADISMTSFSKTFNFTGTGVFGDELTLYLDGQDVRLYQVSGGYNILDEYISSSFQLNFKLITPVSSDNYDFEFMLIDGYSDQGNSYYNISPVSTTLSNKNETSKTAKLTCTLNIPFMGPGFVQP